MLGLLNARDNGLLHTRSFGNVNLSQTSEFAKSSDLVSNFVSSPFLEEDSSIFFVFEFFGDI